MEREIKFRAWNGSKMLKQDEVAFTPGISNVAFRLSDMLALLQKDYHVMQFTGLKDKNGKEIYEGDIILWGVNQGVVEMKKGSWIFADLFGVDENCTVIGNIYETPELLKS